jgi:hypothetical protein
MTGNILLEHWSQVAFFGAVAVQTLSEWYPVIEYLRTWLASKALL